MSLSSNDSSELHEDAITLETCPTCERTFNPKALERHQKICEKTKKCNQRTPFNSFLQRSKEIGAVPVKVESKENGCTKNRRKWREEHESLMHVMRLGKNKSRELLNNGLSPQKTIPPGYQQCPSCERNFSEKAADRHISWCQEQKTRLPKTPNNAEAVERLRARVKYQAPLPKQKSLRDLNERLVKSAESVRESSSFRLHSSPPFPPSKVRLPSASNCSRGPKKSSTFSNINTLLSRSSKEDNERIRKVVKFKEMFPVPDKERNKNLEMLAALRLRLSELSTSEDLVGKGWTHPSKTTPAYRALMCSSRVPASPYPASATTAAPSTPSTALSSAASVGLSGSSFPSVTLGCQCLEATLNYKGWLVNHGICLCNL